MIAKDFNELYDNRTCIPLERIGFIKFGANLFFQRDNVYLALIRNSFRGERVARFLLCLRHSFTRDINDNTYNLLENNPNSYPFRFKPLSLNNTYLKSWHYETFSPNDWHYDKINYGDEKEDKDIIENQLSELAYKIEEYYLDIINMLSPESALFQIKKFNSGWKTESDWIEDYNKFVINYDKKIINLNKRKK